MTIPKLKIDWIILNKFKNYTLEKRKWKAKHRKIGNRKQRRWYIRRWNRSWWSMFWRRTIYRSQRCISWGLRKQWVCSQQETMLRARYLARSISHHTSSQALARQDTQRDSPSSTSQGKCLGRPMDTGWWIVRATTRSTSQGGTAWARLHSNIHLWESQFSRCTPNLETRASFHYKREWAVDWEQAANLKCHLLDDCNKM